MPDGLGTWSEESPGRPDAIINDIQSRSPYGSAILRYAENIYGKNAKPHLLDHTSLRALVHENRVPLWWTSKGHNATDVLAKVECLFDPMLPRGYEMASGAQKRPRLLRSM
jgi:hypothetical protein